MNEKIHVPVYHAAMEAAQGELREIAENMNRLRARQEKIYAAAEALKQVVGSPALVSDSRRTAPVAMPSQQAAKTVEVERVAALA